MINQKHHRSRRRKLVKKRVLLVLVMVVVVQLNRKSFETSNFQVNAAIIRGKMFMHATIMKRDDSSRVIECYCWTSNSKTTSLSTSSTH